MGSWLAARLDTTGIPTTRTILRAVYVVRLCVAIAIYLTAALKVTVAAPLDILVTSILLIATLVVTGVSYWRTHFRGRRPGPTFFYLQAIFDVALITTVVHMTGGPASDLAGLYVLLLVATALLMPPLSTALITTLAGMVYFADILFAHDTTLQLGTWIQLFVFAAVAVVTAYIASKVSVMGAEREALAAEVRQVRLEADDILRNLRTGVITVDGNGQLLYSNPAAEEILGFTSGAWLGRAIGAELARRSPEFWAAVTATARRGVRAMRVEAAVHRTDRAFPVGVTTTTLEARADGVPRVTAIFTDISDSKRLEELRLRAERLEAVAELSSSLAHEIKNPLASIRSSVEQLGRSNRANAEEKFLAGLIVRESDRLARLLSEFLDFSRVRVTECRPIDLYAVAQAAIRLTREHPDCSANARIELVGGPTPMEGDEDLLHRVVSNLVLNAVQAAPPEGVRITVRTGYPAPGDVPAGSAIESPVALEVRDDGPGIPETVRGRLFEPFVSGRVGGTGLGLAIVQRAVDAHRGLVLVDTMAGKGTAFRIYFPAARRKEEAA
jgi:two-component system sensor histidine kinase PilS (NtrC family)